MESYSSQTIFQNPTMFPSIELTHFPNKTNAMDLTIGQHDHSGIHGSQW